MKEKGKHPSPALGPWGQRLAKRKGSQVASQEIRREFYQWLRSRAEIGHFDRWPLCVNSGLTEVSYSLVLPNIPSEGSQGSQGSIRSTPPALSHLVPKDIWNFLCLKPWAKWAREPLASEPLASELQLPGPSPPLLCTAQLSPWRMGLVELIFLFRVWM